MNINRRRFIRTMTNKKKREKYTDLSALIYKVTLEGRDFRNSFSHYSYILHAASAVPDLIYTCIPVKYYVPDQM